LLSAAFPQTGHLLSELALAETFLAQSLASSLLHSLASFLAPQQLLANVVVLAVANTNARTTAPIKKLIRIISITPFLSEQYQIIYKRINSL
jgi:hypothetical protein